MYVHKQLFTRMEKYDSSNKSNNNNNNNNNNNSCNTVFPRDMVFFFQEYKCKYPT
jgi:hypothetical protein